MLALTPSGLLPSGHWKPSAFPSVPLKDILVSTTLLISGLHHAACILATPGSVPLLAETHAGSLLTCWLGFRQVGLEPTGLHPLGNSNQFHGIAPNSKVSGFPWRDQCLVRRGSGPRG